MIKSCAIWRVEVRKSIFECISLEKRLSNANKDHTKADDNNSDQESDGIEIFEVRKSKKKKR